VLTAFPLREGLASVFDVVSCALLQHWCYKVCLPQDVPATGDAAAGASQPRPRRV